MERSRHPKPNLYFFSPPQLFSNLNPTLEDNLINKDNVVEEGIPEERKPGELKEALHNTKTVQEDNLYDNLVETQQFIFCRRICDLLQTLHIFRILHII
jgi:hypothetical protein